MDDIADILSNTDKLEKLRQSADNQQGFIAGKKVMKLDELLSIEFPDNAWLVERLIPLNGTTVISAQPASYKTWLLLDMVISIATDQLFLGQFEVQHTGVLVVDEENGSPLLQQWLNKLGVNDHAPIHFMSIQGFTLDEAKVSEAIRYCKTNNIGLVTLDSLVRIHNGDENDAKQIAQVFKALRKLNSEGITVIVIHHNRKPGRTLSLGSQEMRGSSDILAAVDCHLAIVRDGRHITLKQNKVRLAEELPPLELEVEQTETTFAFKFLGTSVPILSKRTLAKQEITKLIDIHGWLNQKQLHELLSTTDAKVSMATLRAVLTSLIKERVITKSSGTKNEMLYSTSRP